MKGKVISLILAAMMTTALVGGCGTKTDGVTAEEGGNTNEIEKGEVQSETKPAAGSDEAAGNETAEDETLTVWCWDPTFNIYAMQEAEKLYQQEHPNFKLDIQENVYTDIETKLITAAEAGDYSTLPDIFLMQDYSFQKMVTNYPDLFTDLTASGIDFTNFSSGKLADSTVDGKNYGVPFDNGATIMAIRSDIVEEAGFTAEDFKDITWSKLIELGKTVKEKTGLPMLTSSGGAELILQMLQSTGATLVSDGEVYLSGNEALVEAIEVYKELVDTGVMVEYTDWDQYIASMNNGSAAGVVQGCWIMSSIQAAEDQSGKWAIVNMPALDGIEGATNYANCGGSSWAISSNCKNPELAYDFINATFGGSVELYDTLLPNAGVITSYLPAAESSVYQEASEFYGGQKVYADIVDFAGKVPKLDCGAYYSDIRSAITDAATNAVQNDADIVTEIQNAQETVEFNIGG
ncbi:MAG: extracellular solute-binding protein [Roseburia sp.]|nr:extracellular solute-binding protein [Roseburia sp.]